MELLQGITSFYLGWTLIKFVGLTDVEVLLWIIIKKPLGLLSTWVVRSVETEGTNCESCLPGGQEREESIRERELSWSLVKGGRVRE